MRISDWSSDVCSSDLGEFRRQHRPEGHDDAAALEIGGGQPAMAERDALAGGGGLDDHRGIAEAGAALDVDAADAGGLQPVAPVRARSEEHTSELQSLMRSSYAVFCLKKKNKGHRK